MRAICLIGSMLLGEALKDPSAMHTLSIRLQQCRYRYIDLETDTFFQPTGSLSALTVPVLRHLQART
jgi:hypothetical protein